MAYVKLENTQINYGSEVRTDKWILSQIINSDCSYKNPILIRTEQDLELYFGNSYKDFQYHRELLKSGVTLYLYKPITNNDSSINSKETGFIDFSSYSEFNLLEKDSGYIFPKTNSLLYSDIEYEGGIYHDINYILKNTRKNKEEVLQNYRETKIFSQLSELPEYGRIFKYYDNNGNEVYYNTKYIFSVLENGELVNYYYDNVFESYLRIDELPQNLKPSDYFSGKVNRDSLRITCKNWISRLSEDDSSNISVYPEFESCNPRYSTESFLPNYPELPEEIKDIDQRTQLLTSIRDNEEKLNEFPDLYSLAYTFDFSDVSEIKDGDYIVLSDPTKQGGTIYYFGDKPPIGDNEIGGASSSSIKIDIDDSAPVKDKISKLMEEICSQDSYWFLGYIEDSNIYHIWNINGVTKNLQFFNIENLKISPDIQFTQDVLSILSEPFSRIEFYSKTIGPGDENIKIKIEKIQTYNPERYRITISRYSYQEIYESNLYINEDRDGRIENLEYLINKNSKLVECKLIRKTQSRELLDNSFRRQTTTSSYKIDNPDDGLREGEWTLKRAKKEVFTVQDYKNSLLELETENNNIKEDFLLIPENNIFELERLYKYSLSKNCQILITNHEEDYTNNIIKDYKGNPIDLENRLVFFYNDIKYLGNYRPGYYLFLRGIINQNYLLPVNDVVYSSPISNAYIDYSEILEKYKCNYLVFNEHNYYYRSLFSHTGDYNYNLTILSRYCQSHVSKVVEREFKKFLGSTFIGDMMDGINTILRRIKSYNKIIQDLYLEEIQENLQDDLSHSYDVYLHLDIREAAEKDISLGIILNFNLS